MLSSSFVANSVPVSSLRLDYFIRIRLSRSFLSFLPLFPFTLSLSVFLVFCLVCSLFLKLAFLKLLYYFDPFGFLLNKNLQYFLVSSFLLFEKKNFSFMDRIWNQM
jgi:hypothetical protein